MRIRRRWRQRIRALAALMVLALSIAALGGLVALLSGPTAERPQLATSTQVEPGASVAVIPDLEPPTVTLEVGAPPVSLTGQPIAVLFQATAQDTQDGALRAVCLPRPGNLFSVGATAVTCTATDTSGNIGFARGTVSVLDGGARVADNEPQNVVDQPAPPPDNTVQSAAVTALPTAVSNASRAPVKAAAFTVLGVAFAALGVQRRKSLAIQQSLIQKDLTRDEVATLPGLPGAPTSLSVSTVDMQPLPPLSAAPAPSAVERVTGLIADRLERRAAVIAARGENERNVPVGVTGLVADRVEGRSERLDGAVDVLELVDAE